MDDKIYILPEAVKEVLLEYLINRPMNEVEAGVNVLRNLKEIDDSFIESGNIIND